MTVEDNDERWIEHESNEVVLVGQVTVTRTVMKIKIKLIQHIMLRYNFNCPSPLLWKGK